MNLDFFRNLFAAKRDKEREAQRARKVLADAKAAKDAAARRLADADDDWHRLNYYKGNDFLAGRMDVDALPPPTREQWVVLRAKWTPEQYALTSPALQGASGDFGSMRGRTPEAIEAEKWRRMMMPIRTS